MRYKMQKQYRLPKWDYSSPGYYFVTICTKNRKNYFGKIINPNIILSPIGKIIYEHWKEIPEHFQNIELDKWIIMPNHIHGIIIINECLVGTGQCPVPTDNKFGRVSPNSISTMIGSFKSICTRKIKQRFPNSNFAWQSRFNDHVIQTGNALHNIREYIKNNPYNWEFDRNYKK